MKTREQIIAGIRAREAGKKAAMDGVVVGDNPYDESDPLHWDWMDAWCVEKSEALKLQHV